MDHATIRGGMNASGNALMGQIHKNLAVTELLFGGVEISGRSFRVDEEWAVIISLAPRKFAAHENRRVMQPDGEDALVQWCFASRDLPDNGIPNAAFSDPGLLRPLGAEIDAEHQDTADRERRRNPPNLVLERVEFGGLEARPVVHSGIESEIASWKNPKRSCT